MSKEVKISEVISAFLIFIRDSEIDYNYFFQAVNNEEKLSQDYLHKLELDVTSYEDRNKIATKLSINRKDRRFYKDRVEELEPLYQFITDPKNKATISQLRETLGKVRKAESYHQSRTYKPRILKSDGNIESK